MAAIITSSIPTQEFESIRDGLANILSLEFANQYILNNDYPDIQQVWTERVYSFDAPNELPAINVSLNKGDYSNSTLIKQDGSYLFNIDVYTIASTSTGNPGDSTSMKLMEKILGMARAILSFPAYNYPGIVSPNSLDMEVKHIRILEKSTVADALSSMVGRLIIEVRFVENNQILLTGNAIDESTTTVNIASLVNGAYQQSEKGFYYDYKLVTVPVTSTATTLTNAGFALPMVTLTIFDSNGNELATYNAGTAFTQSGTTLTAITFEFTEGTTIIATT